MKKLIFNMIFIFILLSTIFLAGEVAIRLEGFLKGIGNRTFTSHDWLHTSHIPNAHFIHRVEPEGFRTRGSFNSFGLHDEGLKVKGALNTCRIIVVGDSFTEALQVPLEKNFCELLETRLNTQNRPKIFQVINAGISCYSPIREYVYLRRELLKLKPDIVILQFFPNDVFEDARFEKLASFDSNNLPIKIAPFSKNDLIFAYPLKGFLNQRSQFFHFLRRQRIKLLEKLRKEGLEPFYTHKRENQFFILKPGYEKEKEVYWPKTKKYILAIKDLAERNGAKFMLIYIPVEAQLDLKELREGSRFYFDEKANTEANRILGEFCSKNNIKYLDLLPTFNRHLDKELFYIHDGHLTPAGHEIVADSLFDELNF